MAQAQSRLQARRQVFVVEANSKRGVIFMNEVHAVVVPSRGVYSACARCAVHILSNWTKRDIFQIVRSRENHKKS